MDREGFDDLAETPPEVRAAGKAVLVLGPGSGAIALTAAAAERMAERLLAAAAQARRAAD